LLEVDCRRTADGKAQAQADLIRKQRELDDAKREIDLTVQKQVQAALGTVRDQAKQETEAALNLRVREKEEQVASMQREIEDLRRKAEQGSQQLQGEVQELALEALLRQKFPRDAFDPVPKGEFGGGGRAFSSFVAVTWGRNPVAIRIIALEPRRDHRPVRAIRRVLSRPPARSRHLIRRRRLRPQHHHHHHYWGLAAASCCL
jgi:hypothetical protein